MTTARWKSSLANAETAIRRTLGIAGPVNLELEDPARLMPVMLAQDATLPGSHVFRGRAFVQHMFVDDVTDADTIGVLFTDSPFGVLIERVEIQLAIGAELLGENFEIQQIPPGYIRGGTIAFTRDAPFLEGLQSAQDFAPIVAVTADDAGGVELNPSPTGPVIWNMYLPLDPADQELSRPYKVDLRCFLPPPPVGVTVGQNGPFGGGLAFRVNDGDAYTGSWNIMIHGRVG